ncbi:MAG: hypothetical protein ACK4OM_05715 [Alphaproteobacteria bacterium]
MQNNIEIQQQLELIKSFHTHINFFALNENDFNPEFICNELSKLNISRAEQEYIDAPELKLQNFLNSFNKNIITEPNGNKVFHFSKTNIAGIELAIASKIKRIFDDKLNILEQKMNKEIILDNINQEEIFNIVKNITSKEFSGISFNGNILSIKPLESRSDSIELQKKFKSYGVASTRRNPITNREDSLYDKSFILTIEGKEIQSLIKYGKDLTNNDQARENLKRPVLLRDSHILAPEVQSHWADECSQNHKSPVKKQKGSPSANYNSR